MSLEVLKGLENVNGRKVIIMDELKKTHPEMFNESGQMDYLAFERDITPQFPIQIRFDKNSISFTLQNGPIKEVGVNGCQVDDIIRIGELIIERFNQKFPCGENEQALFHLGQALHLLGMRRQRREQQGTEGTNREVEGALYYPEQVVQINPETNHDSLAGCFAIVREVENWGVTAYVIGPRGTRYDTRLEWKEIVPIGKSQFLLE